MAAGKSEVVSVRVEGRTLEKTLPEMYVSQPLAQSLLKHRPDLAASQKDLRLILKNQFPEVADISSDQLVAAIEAALVEGGKFPLTLVVLDEVQQYIGSDAEKAFQVQEVTETLSKHFNGKLLFVGTGQSALSGMPNLQRLMGRFPVQVMLGDWDVENVTRQIILAKKPSAQPEVEKLWRANLGEISRHLRGTKLEHVTDDESVMTSDYPLLPVRRRFWERVLRTIDTTGTVSHRPPKKAATPSARWKAASAPPRRSCKTCWTSCSPACACSRPAGKRPPTATTCTSASTAPRVPRPCACTTSSTPPTTTSGARCWTKPARATSKH